MAPSPTIACSTLHYIYLGLRYYGCHIAPSLLLCAITIYINFSHMHIRYMCRGLLAGASKKHVLPFYTSFPMRLAIVVKTPSASHSPSALTPPGYGSSCIYLHSNLSGPIDSWSPQVISLIGYIHLI
jgi:hypothetical protein